MYADAGSAAVAAEQERLRREEEEEMTDYNEKDLAGGWEFKILRSNTATFRNPETMWAILNEENQRGGWVLVEKFDNCRLRLKRPAGAKAVEGDFEQPYDPYRTEVGTSKGAILVLAIVLPLLFMVLILGLVFALRFSWS